VQNYLLTIVLNIANVFSFNKSFLYRTNISLPLILLYQKNKKKEEYRI